MATENSGVGSGKSQKKAAPKVGDLQSKVSYLPDIHRTMPQSSEAEQGVLASFLLNARDVGGLCAERQVRTEHFHVPAHSTIYEVLMELWDANRPIDFITLTQVLRDRNLLDSVGGPAAVTHLFTYLGTAANAAYYIDILIEKYTLRGIIRVCNEYSARSYEEQNDVPTLLNDVEQKIFAIAQDRYKDRSIGIKKMVMDAITTIHELTERKGSITGLSTGFGKLDQMSNGLQSGEMFIIAARPSMGKTALAMNIAEHIAIELKKAVAVFSLEMSSQQLVQRLLCSRARVNLSNIRNGILAERDFPALQAVGGKLATAKIFIDDTSGLSILELRAKARRMKSQHNIEAIFIDYLQLLCSDSKRAKDNRQQEIAEISAGLKAIAKELSIPVIVLAQLNRNPESRSGEKSKGRPRLSDLRESGSIEQDADVVGLLLRDKYYAENDEERKELEGKATLIIAKNRNGPTGDVALTFLEQFTRFENRADAEPDGDQH